VTEGHGGGNRGLHGLGHISANGDLFNDAASSVEVSDGQFS
jgi:hypothetical protein